MPYRSPENAHITTPKSTVLKKRDQSPVRNLVVLKKGQDFTKAVEPSPPKSTGLKSIEEWVQAAEFTPGQLWKGSGSI